MKRLERKEDIRRLLQDEVDTILLDCDGVIWNGDTLYPGVKEALFMLNEKKIRHFFLSNNATASRAHYAEKFHKLGITYVQPSQIHTSGSATASYLKGLIPTLPETCRDIYLIGQKGLEDELRDAGLTFEGGSDPEHNVFMPAQDFSSITPNPRIGLVVQGFDMHVNYRKYCLAFNYLSQNPTCKLVLTNADMTVFTGTVICPGEGCLAAVLQPAAKETIIVGKPETRMLDVLIEVHGLKRERILMIGDRLETDMLMAKRGGIKGMLVLTGSSTEKDLAAMREEAQPDYLLKGLGDIAGVL